MKTWVKLAAIFVPLAAVGGWILVDGQAREARMTEKTTATLTAVALHKDPESSSLDETRLSYDFSAGGQPVRAVGTLPGDRTSDLRPGQTVTICYNPKNPSETDIELDSAARCGS